MRTTFKFAIAILAFTVIAVAGLNVSHAANVGPSIEVVGGPAAGNYCNGGVAVTVPVQRHLPGAASQFGSYYIAVQGQQKAGMPSASFNYDGQVIFDNSSLTLNLPSNLNLAPNTTLIFAVSTYMETLDTWVYYSWVYFNCSTGAVDHFEHNGFGEPYVAPRQVQQPVLIAATPQPLIRPVTGRP